MELDLFLNRNKIKKDNVFYAASSSFINDGKPVMWRFVL